MKFYHEALRPLLLLYKDKSFNQFLTSLYLTANEMEFVIADNDGKYIYDGIRLSGEGGEFLPEPDIEVGNKGIMFIDMKGTKCFGGVSVDTGEFHGVACDSIGLMMRQDFDAINKYRKGSVQMTVNSETLGFGTFVMNSAGRVIFKRIPDRSSDVKFYHTPNNSK